jgi:hypothetical protein
MVEGVDGERGMAVADPPLGPVRGIVADEVLARFIDAMEERGLTLYEEQEAAILELYEGRHVILKTPTGSGKSLVAGALLFKTLCDGARAVYTCPIKALVNEKFLALCREHGPENVGLMTGDATVNARAPVLCCTAEILANIALRGGERAKIAAVVMDEFHYYGDAERGAAWQIPLLMMPATQFLLMSATLGDLGTMEQALEKRTRRQVVTVSGENRPVPLEFSWSEDPLLQRVENLLKAGEAPIYLVYFTQRSATEAAQGLLATNPCTREERERLDSHLAEVDFSSPFGKDLKRWLRHGIGVHHAGLLPRYRILVETLAQQGLLKLICGTDTLGVGINVPIRTVVFTQLWKYDGRRSAILAVRDFRQIAGRAGRRGFDVRGTVVAQAPEHVIENRKAEEKAAAKGGRKGPRRSAPEGVPVWDEQTFKRLQSAPNETLLPVMAMNHGILLQVLGREDDGCAVLRRLIREAHVTPHRKRELRRRAWALFRALVTSGLLTLRARGGQGPKVRVNMELQEDFSLHQSLSLFFIEALELLYPDHPEYALQVLSLCESILENPDTILYRQVDKLKEELVKQLKAEGVPYEERMERLQEVEHPKPMRDFIYNAFNAFRERQPWAGEETIRPKSIARELYEDYLSFSEYIRRYGLQRAEGLLLRHLSQVYKVLAQTLPVERKTEALMEMEAFFHDLISDTDSSLLEEWERLQNPTLAPRAGPTASPVRRTVDPFGDPQQLRPLIRRAALERLKAVQGGYASPEEAAHFAPFLSERGRIRLDPEARNAKHAHFLEDAPVGMIILCQTLVDVEENNDWEARFRITMAACQAAGTVVLELESVRPIGEY